MAQDKAYGFGKNYDKIEVVPRINDIVQPIDKGGTGATNGRDALSNLNLSSMFVPEVFVFELPNIAGKGSYNKTIVDGIQKSGYKPLAVIYWNLSGAYVDTYITSINLDNQNFALGRLDVKIYNADSSAVTGASLVVRILYVKI